MPCADARSARARESPRTAFGAPNWSDSRTCTRLDPLLHGQWGRMVELQELQIDLLNQIRDER